MAEGSGDIFDRPGLVFAMKLVRRALIRDGLLPPDAPRMTELLSATDDAQDTPMPSKPPDRVVFVAAVPITGRALTLAAPGRRSRLSGRTSTGSGSSA